MSTRICRQILFSANQRTLKLAKSIPLAPLNPFSIHFYTPIFQAENIFIGDRMRAGEKFRCRFVPQSIKALIISRGICDDRHSGRRQGVNIQKPREEKIMERVEVSESRQCEIIGSNAAIGK